MSLTFHWTRTKLARSAGSSPLSIITALTRSGGLQMVDCFKPFLREMPALSLSRKTLRQHRDNICVLGGEVIRRLQMGISLRRQAFNEVYKRYFPKNPPARIFFCVPEWTGPFDVEVDCVAVTKD